MRYNDAKNPLAQGESYMIIYVDASALPGGCGSKESPFQQISAAARIAAPGDEILVALGVYREYVGILQMREKKCQNYVSQYSTPWSSHHWCRGS